MKYAIIADIHGNYPALQSVLEDAALQGADRYIFLGDYIFDLPFSNAVCKCVSAIDTAVLIAGNKEGYLEWLAKEDPADWTHEQMGAVYQTYLELTDDTKRFIAELPAYQYIPSAHGSIYACHALPHMSPELYRLYCCDGEVYEKMEREKYKRCDFLNYYKAFCHRDDVKEIAENINANVILAGHNHIQGYAYIGETLFVNPGSCGVPLDMEKGAAYTLLTETPSGFHVLERRVEYGIDALICTSRQTKIYARGEIWCKLLLFMLKTGIALNKKMFAVAGEIAAAKGEEGGLFSNETWREAYEIIAAEYGDLCEKAER